MSDYNDFFIFIGGLLAFGGTIYFFFRRSFGDIFISDRELSKLIALQVVLANKTSFPKLSKSTVLLIIVVGGFLLNQLIMLRMSASGTLSKQFSISINVTKK